MMERPPPARIQPIVELSGWCVVRTPYGLQLVGWLPNGQFRHSSPIVEFDRSRMAARSRSGRVYLLIGDRKPWPSVRADPASLDDLPAGDVDVRAHIRSRA
jgi:hypothetical protein